MAMNRFGDIKLGMTS